MPRRTVKARWVARAFDALGWVSTSLGKEPDMPVAFDTDLAVHDNKVTGRLEFNGPDGAMSKLILAGRPTSKHGGLQGQHTTAYAVTKEAVVNAIPMGATEDQAKTRVAKLFANLLNYPYVRDIDAEDDAYKVLCTRLSNTDNWGETSLAEAVATYAELRDALPGASLPGEAVSDTTGSGEGEVLKRLRQAEAGGDPGGTPRDLKKDKAYNFIKLLDLSALRRLSVADRMVQAEIYLRSIAQAFPGTFLSPYDSSESVGENLCAALAGALNPDVPEDAVGDVDPRLDADALYEDCRAMAAELVPPDGTARGTGEDFGAALSSPDANGRRKLEFQGRPSSQKDGGSDGNHMTSFRTVSADVSARLMPDGQIPTVAELHERVDEIIAAFDPENFLCLFPNLTEGLTEDEQLGLPSRLLDHFFFDTPDDAFAEIERSEHATMFKRLGSLLWYRDDLRDALGEPPEDGSAQVDAGQLMSIGEKVLALIDERPTSVLYSGVAGGHGEGVYGQRLERMEADAADVPPHEALSLLARQLDIDALLEAEEKFGGTEENEGDAGKVDPAVFQSLVIEEFCECAMRLYPNVVQRIIAPQAALLGPDPDEEAIYNALEAEFGDYIADWGRGEEEPPKKRRRLMVPNPDET